MKIALFGYGNTGKIIAEEASLRGHEIIAIFTSSQQPIEDLSLADVAIDFSRADSVLQHVKLCCAKRVPLVVGTTGWEEACAEIKTLVNRSETALLTAPNFSLGVLLFFRLLQAAARLMNPFPEYDVAGLEVHHRKKKDAPSGTALALARLMQEQMPRVNHIDFASLRVGSVIGEHSVLFDSPFDSIHIQHTAKNRTGYALGALLAAEWLRGKQGFYTLDDWLTHET